METKLAKQFEEIWKLKSIGKGKRYTNQKMEFYNFFLDGFGIALLNIEKEKNK